MSADKIPGMPNPLRPIGAAFLHFLEATGQLATFTVLSVSHFFRPSRTLSEIPSTART